MEELKKKVRFYFWFAIEFIKKNIYWLSIGFVIFFLGISLIFILKPIVLKLILVREEKIGFIGKFNYNNPPSEILNLISRPILILDDKGKVEPILITQWEVKNQGRVFRFYFRKDIIWNDGKKFSVKDIAENLLKNAKIKIIDDYTLQIELENSTVILPYYLRRPIYRYPLIGIGGEYEVVSVKMKEGNFSEILLISKIKGDRKLFRFYNTESELVNAFKAGKVDKFSLTDKEYFNELKEWKNVLYKKETDYRIMAVIFFNLRNNLLAERNFREGIYRLIPWNTLSNYGEISKSPIPPISNFYNRFLPNPIYDPDNGLKMIKEVVRDKKVKLKIKTDYRLSYIAETLSEFLSQAGIEAEIEAITVPEEDFDILLAFWKVPLEVDQYFFWHSTQSNLTNKTGYKNLKVDKYLEEARSTFVFEKQYIALKKFQEEITREKPAIFLYFPYVYHIERKRLF